MDKKKYDEAINTIRHSMKKTVDVNDAIKALRDCGIMNENNVINDAYTHIVVSRKDVNVGTDNLLDWIKAIRCQYGMCEVTLDGERQYIDDVIDVVEAVINGESLE